MVVHATPNQRTSREGRVAYQGVGHEAVLHWSAGTNVPAVQPKRRKRRPIRVWKRAAAARDARDDGDCVLCLLPRRVHTAFACGHAGACWACAAAWVREKPECPMCRAPCQERDLLALDY